MHGYGPVAPGQLVLTLGPGLDNFEATLNGEVYRLMITDLEVQERVVLDTAPVAAIECVRTDEVDGACDVAAVAPGHDQQNILRHALADERKELPVEIGPPPFAAACIHVEGKEIVPDLFGNIAACQPVDGDSGGKRFAPLPFQRLALARSKRGEEIFIVFKAFVEEVELLVGAMQEA